MASVSWHDGDQGQRPTSLSTWQWESSLGYSYNWFPSGTETPIYNLTSVPELAGYKFGGYECEIDGSTARQIVINSDGSLVQSGNKLKVDAYDRITLYAIWTESSYVLTFSNGAGTGGTTVLYQSHAGSWYKDAEMTTPATQPIAVPTPRTDGYRFKGYYSAASGGTQWVTPEGTFTDAFLAMQLSTDRAAYAQYELVSRKITLNQSSGSGGTPTLWYKISGGGIYTDMACTTPATAVVIPSSSNYRFMGYYSAASGGTQYIDASGNILPALQSATFSTATTIYAQYNPIVKATLDKAGGTGGADGIWRDTTTGEMFSDESCQSTVTTSIATPTRPGNRFMGYFSAASGGTQYVTNAGALTSSFPSFTSAVTFYAQWNEFGKVLTLDAQGGSGAPSMLFFSGGNWYLDDALSQAVTSITPPTRTGHTFNGFYVGSTLAISSAGQILLSSISADTTAIASWTANTYTLRFEAEEGVVSFDQKVVTFGQPIGVLPTVTGRKQLTGWKIGTRMITAETVWNLESDATAIAEFGGSVGYHIDWFGLASDALVPIASDSGDGQKRVTVYHTGQIEPGVGQTSGTWRNPSVTYRVVKNVNFSTTLGLAFAASANTTGYVITEVDVQTEVGQFPTVRVSAVANEGANAINLFPITIPIAANAHAQRLLNAVVGEHLQSCSLAARCQPVIVEENLMPVASDVVAAKITVNATTVSLLPGMEYAPRAGSGFTAIHKPTIGTDGQCQSFSITVEKDMTKS